MTRIDLSIGDVRIEIEADADGPTIAASGASRRFEIERNRPPDLALRARWGEPSSPRGGQLLFESGGVWSLHRHGDRLVYRLTSPAFGSTPYKEARMSADLSSGEVILSRDALGAPPDIYPLEYPLDEILVTHRLARLGGVELHGCGLVDPSGRGLLFLGQSGAGKTTTARLWTGATGAMVLSDDRIVVRHDGTSFRMWGTPWHGEEELAEPRDVKLDRVFLLRQAPGNEIEALPSAEAVARIIGCSFPPFHDRAGVEAVTATLDRLVGSVRCDELRFRNDPSAVESVVKTL